MKYANKLMVVPYVNRLEKPIEKYLLNLDSLMSEIVNKKDMSVDEKVKKYAEALVRFRTNYTESIISEHQNPNPLPVMVMKEEKIGEPKDDVFVEDDVMRNDLKNLKKKASKLKINTKKGVQNVKEQKVINLKKGNKNEKLKRRNILNDMTINFVNSEFEDDDEKNIGVETTTASEYFDAGNSSFIPQNVNLDNTVIEPPETTPLDGSLKKKTLKKKTPNKKNILSNAPSTSTAIKPIPSKRSTRANKNSPLTEATDSTISRSGNALKKIGLGMKSNTWLTKNFF